MVKHRVGKTYEKMTPKEEKQTDRGTEKAWQGLRMKTTPFIEKSMAERTTTVWLRKTADIGFGWR